jgi:4-aminobutyrate---pyruvate transaminase
MAMTYIAPNSIHARDIAHFVHPQTNLARHEEQGPVVITRGEGIYVYDEEGREYLEGAAGLWCASLGFNNERLAKVAFEQMTRLGYYHSYRHNGHEPGIDLAERLIKIAPVAMSKALFQCSGSEANDTAIKLAWYYHAAIGKPEKRKIIGRKMAYHGSTCAAISASGKPDMHADFGLPLPPFRHTEFPHYYRCHEEGESEEKFATRMADALEALIIEEGPETVAAFIAEPVMGAGGAILPPETYFAKIQAVLDKYEVLFIADEVICGFGRTGNMWGSETFDLKPDMITCAKALSAAKQPISALLINEKIYQAMLVESRKLGNFAHGYTYWAHPVAAAVALEVQRIYEERSRRPCETRRQAYAAGAGPAGGPSPRRRCPWRRPRRRPRHRRRQIDPRDVRRGARCPSDHRAQPQEAGADPAGDRQPHRAVATHHHHRKRSRRNGRAPQARARRYRHRTVTQLYQIGSSRTATRRYRRR